MSSYSGDGSLFRGATAAFASIPDATPEAEIKAVRYVARQVEMTPGERFELLEALGLVDVARGMQAGEAA